LIQINTSSGYRYHLSSYFHGVYSQIVNHQYDYRLYLTWSFGHAAAQPLKRCVSGLSGFTLMVATVAGMILTYQLTGFQTADPAPTTSTQQAHYRPQSTLTR
jgi:hypothetical protein